MAGVRFWKSVLPLVRRLKRLGFPVNRAVNEGCCFGLGSRVMSS